MREFQPSSGDTHSRAHWHVPVLLCMLVSSLWTLHLFLPSRAATSDSESIGLSITITASAGSGFSIKLIKSCRGFDGFSINLIAAPEKRVPSTGNDDTRLEVEVRNIGSTTPLLRQIVRTGSGGTFSGFTLTGINAGSYDITAKGYSHLRRKMPGVSLSSGTTIDFSTGGTVKLLCGDVNSSSGDNLVNGIDLTLIINDLTGNTERYDMNRDTVVNGIDLTNAITNLTETGDS